MASYRWTFARLAWAMLFTSAAFAGENLPTCESRFYCKTNEIKYISMNNITNAYLNATAMRTYDAKDVADCQKYCVRDGKCSSMNMNNNISQNCHLLDVNIYSNASLLVKSNGFTHFYVPSPCTTNPCQNGGTCIPSYKNNSYTCVCESSNLSVVRGFHCEKRSSGSASAYLYWPVDDLDQTIPLTSSNLDVSAYKMILRRISFEPGRKNPVADCEMKHGHCMWFYNNIPCLTDFTACDASAITYSIWIKFAEKEVARSRYTNILATYSYGSRRGLIFGANKDRSTGFRFKISVTTSKRWTHDKFGTDVIKTIWNHFVFAFDNEDGVCIYINGLKELCGGTASSVSLFSQGTVTRIGSSWYANSATDIFVDEFAVWKSILTEAEVSQLYNQSRS